MAEALNPGLALLFGLVAPPRVPLGAPRRQFKVRDDDDEDAGKSPAYLAAKARRLNLLKWLSQNGEQTTVQVADALCVSTTCAFHDLRLLRRMKRVQEARRALVRGRYVVFWRAA